MLAANTIHLPDAPSGLGGVETSSIDCCVTSPPYYLARDYGVPHVHWSDGTNAILGLEDDCDQYVQHLLDVFEGELRVLKPTGTLWVNLADSYGGQSVAVSHAKHSRGKTPQLPTDFTYMPPKGGVGGRWRKCLLGIPERFVLGMLKQGWTLRNRVVWYKPNHLPASVRDRFTASWEFLFFFVKSARYHFDLDAVREPHQTLLKHPALAAGAKKRTGRTVRHISGHEMPPSSNEEHAFHPLGRNPGDHWTITPECRSLAGMLHISDIRKSTPGAVSAQRITTHSGEDEKHPEGLDSDHWSICTRRSISRTPMLGHFAAYPEELCRRPILAGCPPDGIVLDPFCASGTTCVVAKRLDRRFLGLELNPDYVKLAEMRLNAVQAAQPGGAEPCRAA